MKRHPTNVRKDQKIFSQTASKSKAVNLPVVPFRGGIRF